MKSIIEREATFDNNSDMEVKVTQKQLSRAFVKETQWWARYTVLETMVICLFVTLSKANFEIYICLE